MNTDRSFPKLVAVFLCVFSLALPSVRAATLVFEGTNGIGKGKHIVFLAGDHEYRSEESLPALARLLAKHHGFKCTVLFDIDENGNIVAGVGSNMPGLEALQTADLAVVFLRFQNFSVEQMKHFDDYLQRGGPIVGLRTATHAFKTPKDDPFAKYSYDSQVAGYESGFGHQVLGQTWVGHYGKNHQQSTRISIVDDKKDHPILRGVKNVWVQAGAYVGKPTDGEILTMAQPLDGMTPDSPASTSQPPQPSEWTRTYRSTSGKENRVFTSLYGTSEDITNDGYRRLLVNGILWSLGMEDSIKTDLNVSLVGPFQPNTFSNGGYARGIKPDMYAGYESPIPANNNTVNPDKKDSKKDDRKPKNVDKKQPQASTPANKDKESAKASLVTGKPARFVRIELPGEKRILTLAEVEVISGGMNIAGTGKASQSTTMGDAVAARATDGNKNSDFTKKGQTHTSNSGSKEPWWELDLGKAVDIESIGIWNRSSLAERLDGFTLTLLDDTRKEVFRISDVAAPQSMKISVKSAGKLEYLTYDGKPGKPFARIAKTDNKSKKPKPEAIKEPILADVPADFRDPLPFVFQKNDIVAILGNGLPDRFQHDGWMETLLQSANPGLELRFRNMSVSGDRPDSFPRSKGATSMTDYLRHVKADVVFAFFGYNESFDGIDRADEYRKKLVDFVKKTRGSKANGRSFPRIVLFSPIAHEDTGNVNVPDGKAHNSTLEAYTAATEAAAKEAGVEFVDLFHPTLALFKATSTTLTINGVHLTEEGNRRLAEIIATALLGQSIDASASMESLRAAVNDKDLHWQNRYRASDGNDVWGSRSTLTFTDDQSNAVVLQHELSMLDLMTANRDPRIWSLAQGKELKVDDGNVPKPIPVVSNVGGKSKSSSAEKEGSLDYISGEDAIKYMATAKGFEINLFADEARFPQLANPVQMQVDNRGRIWAAVWPTYPKWEPLKPMNDALLICHDDDNDGRADRLTEFAKVQNPLGFEFWNNGVLVTCMSELIYLRDTNGDDKADERIVMLQGLDTSDTHHGANNLIFGPDGAIYWQSGVFMQHNHEHPWGPSLNTAASAMYRFDPRRFTISMHAPNSPNSHGTAYDYWGNQYATDGTSGRAFHVRPDAKGFKMTELLKKEVRPVTASEIVSSTHFPDSMQGDFLICNVIGFLGIKQYRLDQNAETGAVWGEPSGDELVVNIKAADGTTKEEKSRGLLMSGDKNFRPSDAVFGADGALYICDWHNVIIGHMQHNVRDPNRDHIHGRIYRMTAKGRPLQAPVEIAGAPIAKLLDNLKHPTDGVRHRSRIELSGRDTQAVMAETKKWMQQFDPTKKEDAHHFLEALWLHQQHNVRNLELLGKVLNSPEPMARYAAATVQHLWFNMEASFRGGIIAEEKEAAQEKSGILSDTPELTTIRIGTVREKMMYDVKQLGIKPGKKIKLTFANVDFMPHNILLVKPGKADEVGVKAVELGASGFEVGFVPESPDILWASKLVDYGQEEVIEFTAPTEPGFYPYICSFPGHHLVMRGIFIVADDPEAYLAKNPLPTTKATFWKLSDFTDADFKRVEKNRNFENAKQQFGTLACAQCHLMGKEGNDRGPNLIDVVKKHKNDAKAILQEILEPSKNIEEKYRNVVLALDDDSVLTGLILKEDESELTIQTGPNVSQVQKIAKDTISGRRPSPISMMPEGLLHSRDKEQILDLLAYLLAAGSPDHAAFKQAHGNGQ